MDNTDNPGVYECFKDSEWTKDMWDGEDGPDLIRRVFSPDDFAKLDRILQDIYEDESCAPAVRPSVNT